MIDVRFASSTLSLDRREMRLNFSNASSSDLDEGIRRWDD